MSPSEASVLARIVGETREELRRRKQDAPLASLDAAASGRERRSLRAALGGPRIGVIAEFKRRSPSAGALRDGCEVQLVVGCYERGGAAALSVLTERANFGGSLEDLADARDACALPILRKDFIVDPYQLHEALAAGADAVLLIVAALDDADLGALHAQARGLGLEVLVEIHDRAELKRALAVGAELIGVNNRDLRDFSVDVERTFELLDRIPDGVTVVSESGIASAAQLQRLQDAGVDGALIGESLMRSDDPEAVLRSLTAFKNAERAL